MIQCNVTGAVNQGHPSVLESVTVVGKLPGRLHKRKWGTRHDPDRCAGLWRGKLAREGVEVETAEVAPWRGRRKV